MSKYTALLVLFVIGCVGGASVNDVSDISQISDDVQFLEDGTPYLVHPSKIRGGGPPRDGIPSIDNPKFELGRDAHWLDDNDLVMGIEYNGIARAYPFPVLVWHEIVNDNIAGDEILITYCPLCQTGIAFDPVVGGERVEFGTSGKLFNSNLVMYDRKTETYWTQVGGRAILGERAGDELEMIPIDTVRWGDWFEAHPDTQVLSRNTGFSRNYGADPYGNYYTSDAVWFPLENDDFRLHPKDYVLGLDINDEQKAYPEAVMAELRAVNDNVGGESILAIHHPVTKAVKLYQRDNFEFNFEGNSLVDTDGNEWDILEDRIVYGESELLEIAGSGGFWFSWAAFNPDTTVLEL